MVESDVEAIATTFAVTLSIASLTTMAVVLVWTAFSWRALKETLSLNRELVATMAQLRVNGFEPKLASAQGQVWPPPPMTNAVPPNQHNINRMFDEDGGTPLEEERSDITG